MHNKNNTQLYSTKLQPPRTRSQLVSRSRLIKQFPAINKQPKLTLLVAPAGYGKSTLLAQLLKKREEHSIAWIGLDDSDNNLDTFLDYLWAAFKNVAINENIDDLSTEFNASIGGNAKSRLQVLFNAIEAAAKPIQFVLDDFHLITKDKILESIDWIIQFMPEHMSLILASRQQPKLSCITQLKAQGDLFEIPVHQLNFNLKEVASFVSNDKKIHLNESSLKSLFHRTEGWVGATQLALHALHSQDNQDEFVTNFSGSDRDIVKYLGECLLDQQDQENRQFFLYSSVLTHLSAPLCDEVTGLANSSATLERIAQDGLFLFELDREQIWFRYHHLCKEFLFSQLEILEPEKPRQLFLKAANWFQQKDDINQAINYYLLAKEFETAASLIAQKVSNLVQYQGNHEVLLGWIEALPREIIAAEPRIAIGMAWSLSFTRDLKSVEGVLDMLRCELNNKEIKVSEKNQQDVWLGYNLDMLESIRDIMVGKNQAARARSEKWLEDWPHAPEFETGAILSVLGASCWQTLEFKKARSILTQAKKVALSCGTHYGVAWIDLGYAMVHNSQGHLIESKHLLQAALKNSNEKMGEHSLASDLIKIGMAQVYYQTNEIELAQKNIDIGFLSVDEHGLVDTLQVAFIIKAKLLLVQGLQNEAYSVLLDAQALGRRLDLLNFEAAILGERIHFMLLAGKIDKALQLYQESELENNPEQDFNISPCEVMAIKLVQSRMALAQGDNVKALEIISEAIRRCKQTGFVQAQQIFQVLEARTYFELNKKNQAFRQLNYIINACQSEGNIGLFRDEQDHFTVMLPEFLSRIEKQSAVEMQDHQQQAFLEKVSHILKIKAPIKEAAANKESASKENNAPGEKLTKRELELLGYLDQGLSNQNLADVLFLSVATIKWHLSHIYTKLGVKNRLGAIKAFQKLKQ
ncbi:MAG: LuxR C-terminal-related transcriptional regulator [Bermanella sp.]